MDLSRQNIVVIVTIALLIGAVGYIIYDKATGGEAEVIIPSEAAPEQLVMPPEPARTFTTKKERNEYIEKMAHKGIAQKEIAAKTGLSEATISKILHKKDNNS